MCHRQTSASLKKRIELWRRWRGSYRLSTTSSSSSTGKKRKESSRRVLKLKWKNFVMRLATFFRLIPHSAIIIVIFKHEHLISLASFGIMTNYSFYKKKGAAEPSRPWFRLLLLSQYENAWKTSPRCRLPLCLPVRPHHPNLPECFPLFFPLRDNLIHKKKLKNLNGKIFARATARFFSATVFFSVFYN